MLPTIRAIAAARVVHDADRAEFATLLEKLAAKLQRLRGLDANAL